MVYGIRHTYTAYGIRREFEICTARRQGGHLTIQRQRPTENKFLVTAVNHPSDTGLVGVTWYSPRAEHGGVGHACSAGSWSWFCHADMADAGAESGTGSLVAEPKYERVI